MEIGGGFGGKGQGGCYLEPVVAALSRKCGQPVKIAMTRGEVFEGTGPTSASHIRVKLGATREGKLTAADCTLVYEAGAFPGSPVPSGCRTMLAPYDGGKQLHRGHRRRGKHPKGRCLPGARLTHGSLCRRVGHRRNLRADRDGPG